MRRWLRDMWKLLGALLSGELLRRMYIIELALEDEVWRRMRLEQSHKRLDDYARSKLRALTIQGNTNQLSIMKLSTMEVDRREGEAMQRAITLDDDEETIAIELDEDSKA